MTGLLRETLGRLDGALRRRGTLGAIDSGSIARAFASITAGKTKKGAPQAAVAAPKIPPRREAAGYPKKTAPRLLKRPPTAYSLYVKHTYPTLKKAEPKIMPNDAYKTIAKMWKDAPQEERAQYQNESNLLAAALATNTSKQVKTQGPAKTVASAKQLTPAKKSTPAKTAAPAKKPKPATTPTPKRAKGEVLKKPLSAYLVYSRQMYPSLKARFPNDNMVDLTRRIGEMWRFMGAEEKQLRLRKAERERRAFDEGQGGIWGK